MMIVLLSFAMALSMMIATALVLAREADTATRNGGQMPAIVKLYR